MCGRILVFCCIFFVAITQSGCFGLIVNTTAECKNESPFPDIHNNTLWRGSLPPRRVATKEAFLKDWGNPDEIISTSENEETWIYDRKLWCGVIPILFVLPVPLILPVCDGFDRIEFHGNEAKNLHTRHIVESGFYVGMREFAETEPACRLPLPSNNGVDSDAEKPAAQVIP
jgi:hypothetical protein